MLILNLMQDKSKEKVEHAAIKDSCAMSKHLTGPQVMFIDEGDSNMIAVWKEAQRAQSVASQEETVQHFMKVWMGQ